MNRRDRLRARTEAPLLVARAAAAQVAVDFVRPKHWIAQAILAVLAVLLAWQGGGWWLLFVPVVLAMLVLGFVYWVVLRIICRLGAPKHLRREVKDVNDEIRAVFEELRLPTGVVGSVAFAVRLATGKRPHDRVPEAARRVQALLDRARAEGGGDRGPDRLIDGGPGAGQPPTGLP